MGRSTRHGVHYAVIALGVACAAACAQTQVRPGLESGAAALPRPERILVHDLAVSPAEVQTNQGAVSQALERAKPAAEGEREREIGRQARNAFSDDLVEGLINLGFAAKRVPGSEQPGANELLIDGEFLDVDEGNKLRRLVIGFGAGGSNVAAQVRLHHGARLDKLVEFMTHADSGKMPGAAVTMGAGAAAQGGLKAGAVAANAAVGGVKANRTETEQMAAKSAVAAVGHLAEYFAKQGWIRPDEVPAVKGGPLRKGEGLPRPARRSR